MPLLVERSRTYLRRTVPHKCGIFRSQLKTDAHGDSKAGRETGTRKGSRIASLSLGLLDDILKDSEKETSSEEFLQLF